MTRGAPPQDAFFAATDYCYNPASPGGRFYVMRARRDSPTGVWQVEPGAVAMQVAGGVREHIHPGGVIPFGGSGIRAFFPVGDGRRNSRIVSLISPDGSYTSGEWQVDETYHGAEGVPGLDANLFMGCAPGPLANTAVVGGDLINEQFMLLTMDERAPHPPTERLHGQSCSDGNGYTAFMIRTPTPELGGPYIANAEPWAPAVLPYSRRAVYSQDGVHWAQAIAPDGGGGYPILHDGHIYFGIADSHGFAVSRAPVVVTARPLLVGPGGLQHAAANPVLTPESMPRMTLLQRDALGRWVDEGVPLNPQPPTLGAVYRVTTSADDPSIWVGRIYPAGYSSDAFRGPTRDLQLRIWAHHQDPSRSATLSIGVGDSANPPSTYRSWIIASTNGWIPAVTQPLRPPADGTFRLSIRCLGTECTDQTMYLALDNVQETIPGYPMPPDISNPPAGTAYPDERARITGLACQEAWTVTLALQIPEDGFDYRTPGQTLWPLGCIWADDHNYVAFSADTTRGQIWATLNVRGAPSSMIVSDATVLERGSPILLSIAQPLDSTAGIEITASVGSRDASTALIPNRPDGASRLSSPPREIRFWSQEAPPSSSGEGAATSPLLVWGGRVDEGRALSRPERELLLERLSFLSESPPNLPIPCPCDWTGDGALTSQDFFAFLDFFFANDADYNSDGATNSQDLFGFLQCFLTAGACD